MKTECVHPIRYVAQHTRLKPYLIRTWEERYGAVCPQRTTSNQRLYSDRDIRRLRLLKRAVDCGHAISAVVPLNDDELALLIDRANEATATVTTDEDAASLRRPSYRVSSKDTVQAALTQIARLDATALEKVLSDAAVDMPRQSLIQLVIVPLFQKVGELWREGKLKIINEHMASVVVRAVLWDMLRAVMVSKTAPGIVIATPVGHWHEIGALASAMAASESGWRVHYFGPNLPSEEIAYAVKKTGARALSLSLCHQIDDGNLGPELRSVRRLVGPEISIFIGGPGSALAEPSMKDIVAMIVNDLSVFRERLEALAERPFR